MKLRSQSFQDGARIPGEFAFCVIDPRSHVALSGNRNPHLHWSEVPAAARSFVLLCVDPDVPSRADDVNQEGREVPADLPRLSFFHWTLIDLPVDVRTIEAGECCKGITPHGKGGPATRVGDWEVRHGLNDYTGWFASDRDMAGDWYGYDGPCPPWNDVVLHRYVFTVYALDVDRLALDPALAQRFEGRHVLEAMQGHILDQASLTGIYTLNPRLA